MQHLYRGFFNFQETSQSFFFYVAYYKQWKYIISAPYTVYRVPHSDVIIHYIVFDKQRNIWVLRHFQEYFTYIEPIVNQSWAKTGVSGEKPPDLPVQNLAPHICPAESRTTVVGDPMFKNRRSKVVIITNLEQKQKSA